MAAFLAFAAVPVPSVGAQELPARQPVPMVGLSGPDAVAQIVAQPIDTFGPFGAVNGAFEFGNKWVLVNDGSRRQLVLFNAELEKPQVLLDSAAGGATAYGPRAVPLIPYIGDSVLFPDVRSGTFLVIASSGKIAHVITPPRISDFASMLNPGTTTDARGNLYYRGAPLPNRVTAPSSAGMTALPATMIAPILRVNFETRAVDTVAHVVVPTTYTRYSAADKRTHIFVNPLSVVDDWAVLSDGSVAVVRGDYHIEWIAGDGRRFSSAQLPFDHLTVTEEAKRAILDSVTRAETQKYFERIKRDADAKTAGLSADGQPVTSFGPGGFPIGGLDHSSSERSASANAAELPPVMELPPPDKLPNQYPPLRAGWTKADRDGNLWVLPIRSPLGDQVYDVVNNRGELVKRVRMPSGYSIVGFGRGGVVYVAWQIRAGTWSLERRHLQ